MQGLYKETGKTRERSAFFSSVQDGMRLDAALASVFDDLSRNRAQKLIESGSVNVNELTLSDKNARVSAGDAVCLIEKSSEPLHLEAENIAIDVVYEDDDLIVVNKEKGMVVHPAPGNVSGTLVNALLGYYEGASQLETGVLTAPEISGVYRPGIVHRIDKNTSGLLVVAKSDRAQASLSDQLKAHSMERVYMAIAVGRFKDDEGTIDLPIGRDPKDRKKRKVISGSDSRRAVTHWRVVERFDSYTLIELKLETGRTHQIRVHMAHIGRPLLGDDSYGPAKVSAKMRQKGESQYLHATLIGFEHPADGRHMVFQSELPDYFENMLSKLRS